MPTEPLQTEGMGCHLRPSREGMSSTEPFQTEGKESHLRPLYALWEVDARESTVDDWLLVDLKAAHSSWSLARAQQELHPMPTSLMYQRNIAEMSGSSAAEEAALSLASGAPDVPSHLECFCSETIPAASLTSSSELTLHFAPALHPWLPSAPALAAELQARGLEPTSVGDVLGALITSALHASELQVYGEHVFVGDLQLSSDGQQMRTLLVEAGDSFWRRLLGELCDVGHGGETASAGRLSQRNGSFTLVIATREDDGGPQEPAGPEQSATPLKGRRRRQRAFAAALAVSGHELAANDGALPADAPSYGSATCGSEETGDIHHRTPRSLAALLVLPRNDATSRQALKLVLQRAARVVRDALCGVASATKAGQKRRR